MKKIIWMIGVLKKTIVCIINTVDIIITHLLNYTLPVSFNEFNFAFSSSFEIKAFFVMSPINSL